MSSNVLNGLFIDNASKFLWPSLSEPNANRDLPSFPGCGVLKPTYVLEGAGGFIRQSNEMTVAPVDYPSDIFEKNGSSSNKVLFTASDGKQYDLVSYIEKRMSNALVCFYTENEIESKLWEWIKEKIGIGNASTRINKIYEDGLKVLSSSDNINEKFYKLTGKEYIQENVEKFLKSELKLNIETRAEEYIGKELNIPDSIPFVSQNYISPKNKIELDNSRTKVNKKEMEMYKFIQAILSSEYQSKLENALKNGQLLQNNAEDESTVLENLYKIATIPRVENVKSETLLEECLDILDNPYIITQHGENIPKEYQEECKRILKDKENISGTNVPYGGNISSKMNTPSPIYALNSDYASEEIQDDVFENRNLGTCTAACIEFNMAVQNTAEFFRMVEGLTSKEKVFKKKITMNEKMAHMIKNGKTPYERNNNETIVDIFPDKNAFLLAEIQTKYKDEGERSIIDILLQSAIMNLGSRQTYNSVSDMRMLTELSSETSGLIDEEIAFVQEILTGNSGNGKRYMNLSSDGHVIGKENPEKIKNEILSLLLKNGSVVAGIVYISEGFVCGAHEITIIGYTQNIKGSNFFIIQDSDDEYAHPVTVPESELLSQIHHIAP